MASRLVFVLGAAALVAVPARAQTSVTPSAPVGVTAPVAATAGEAAKTGAATVAAPIKVTAAAKPDPTDLDAVVCKTEVNSGSRIQTTKRCQTRRQWNETGRDMQKMVNDYATPKAGN